MPSVNNAVNAAIKDYLAAETMPAPGCFRAQGDAKERAFHACETREDWEAVLAAFGEREVGSYISCEPDGDWASDGMGNGIAMVDIGEHEAIVCEWFDSGRHDVSFTSRERAEAVIAKANEEWNEEENEDEDEDEEPPEDTPCLDTSFYDNESDID